MKHIKEIRIQTPNGGVKSFSDLTNEIRKEEVYYFDFADWEPLPVDEFIRRAERRALRKALLFRRKRKERGE